MKMKEWIGCANEDCDSIMRYDPDDKEYSCSACDARLKPVRTPNIEQEEGKHENT